MTIDSPADLISASVSDLCDEASKLRNRRTGNRITYSPKVFIPLTMLCRDRCGYCTFAKAPARIESPFMEIEEILELAQRGSDAGCHEALFTLGEAPEDRYELAQRWLQDHGYQSTVEYLVDACAAVVKETGLLPHANAGALSKAELLALREVSASQGMMLESLRGDLDAHRLAPDKTPERRLATLEAAGELAIPFTTGVLVGIGENRQDILDALLAIGQMHERYGHIQEVIVQNFLPKPGTAMAKHPACDPEEHRWAIAAARLLLPADIHLQAPPNLTDDVAALISAGIDDLGGVSPITADHVNPERAWPTLALLADEVSAAGFELAPRMTIYPEFAAQREQWIAPAMMSAVLAASDADGLSRDDLWFSGADCEPPNLLATLPGGYQSAGSEVLELLCAAQLGQELDEAMMTSLFSARGSEVRAIAAYADQLRKEVIGGDVTYVFNRNINYTNVCTFKCKFCAFSKGPLSLNLRGAPYVLTLGEVTERVAEAAAMGATEVCLQGGIHPDFDAEYYLDVVKAVREGSENIHIHAFSALEVHEGARRAGIGLFDYLSQLRDAGLILHDDIRAVICPDKVNTEQWLEVHRQAHAVGLSSNVTIMFGSVEQPKHWARHIAVTRALARETGGFTEFVPLPFVHMATPVFLRGGARRGPTFRETLLMHAVGRIAYRGVIDNIQASWVKLGTEGTRQLLNAGVNDLGGTLIDENISRAAGALHGQAMDADSLAAIVAPLGRPVVQRTTLYGRPA
ncbi:MAG: 5-amino-6-(D-ribitylamino)uracil--L-tyrosine 4-hydroxyphenyl transferase CofH [Actinobacteria bacterium]|nr:5-amino-6-(D-ribitylamino)uracil--L-tyrosine 4-hydroxyphenyl transferase CofH [Actinomycetota bacterium]